MCADRGALWINLKLEVEKEIKMSFKCVFMRSQGTL